MNQLTCRRFSAVAARLSACLLVFGGAIVVQAATKIDIAPDVETGVYDPGQNVTWNITVTGGAAPVAGKIEYSVRKAGQAEISAGKVELQDGKARVTASREDVGTLLLTVKYKPADSDKDVVEYGGAAFAPEKIPPSSPPPDDFDDFWKAKLGELAGVPMNAKLVPVDSGDPRVEYFQITLDGIRGTKVYGQIAKPAGKTDLPALLRLQWSGVYGLQPNWVVGHARDGWLAMNISAHDLPIDEKEAFYREKSRGELGDYPAIGNDDREASYFLRMILGCCRSIDYLTTRPDWNKKSLVLHGSSQGGYLSLATAALQPAVTALAAEVPAGCDHTARQAGRASCWPHWGSRVRPGKDEAKLLAAARYFDAVNFGHRIKCSVLVGVGLLDTTCPAENVLAAYNQIQSPKKSLVIMPRAGHNDGDHTAYIAAFIRFMKTQETAEGPAPGAASEEIITAVPRLPATLPADAEKTFHTLRGFRMDLIASEPLTTDPVAMAYDENGLAWVVEMSDYPYSHKEADMSSRLEQTKSLPIGCVRILEDTDGDGKFDKSEVFARDLSWPTGIALYDGGAFVAATPDIWYLKDTDGDRRADIRIKVFTGFRKTNAQAAMNNLIWGLDHKIYGAGASNGGLVHTVGKPDTAPVKIGQNDYCFDPLMHDFQAISGGARFGNSFDDWGRRFICNLRSPAQNVVLPAKYLARNPYLPVPAAVYDVAVAGDTLAVFRTSPPEPWRAMRARRFATQRDKNHPRSETAAEGYVTSASGITLYRGAAYPPEYYNNIFVGEVAGNLVHRQILSPDGVTFVAKRGDPNTEFVSSEDTWFRPVNFINAPDGTLHVLDMYRETIEAPDSIPDDLRAHLDLESGRDRGRIYRLSPPNFQVPKPPRLGKATTAELVKALENPNSWWRDTAHRLLFERKDKSAVAPLQDLLRRNTSPLGRVHALWSLAGLDALTDADVLLGLIDPVAGVRENAVQLAEPRLKSSRAILERVVALAADPNIRVRFQVAFTLGEVADPLATEGLLKMARRDAADPWIRVAILSSLSETADAVLVGLLKDTKFAADATNGLPFARQLAVVVGARNRPEEVDRVVAALAALPASPTSRVIQTNALLGLGDGLKRARTSISSLAQMPDTPAAKLINAVLTDSAEAAKDSNLPLAARKNAVEILSYGTFQQAKPAALA